MSKAPRVAAVVAVLTLPVAALVAGWLLIANPEPPRVPAVVRVGESAPVVPSPSTTPAPPSPSPEPGTPERSQLPPPPPVDDDDEPDDDPDDDLLDDDG